MKVLTHSISFFTAIAVSLASGLNHSTLAQTDTFIHNEITYTVTFKKRIEQNVAFTLSYADSNANTHIVEYQGTCGTNIIGVLGETVVNTQGKVISKNTATQAVIFDLSANSDWEMSGAIRQGLDLMCNSSNG
ncbi:hypothetical protein [Gloeothece verrucosa]|uniref:Uncharacterized protein n=1 Tax=Gloeothece verrucosa (strain PCC 7822) TaxID=497965 RepID=E0UED8_GLOV7|nr:hypothetical protein [Gloeothece verrucosa]ADN15384.1 hypothetical protein Cyan7822_3435 [Gloeothece verrucosa PCC 7822]